MQLFIRCPTGKTLVVQPTSATTTVAELKALVSSKCGVEPGKQRLLYERHQLSDEKSLGEYGIENDATIMLALRLRGGDGATLLLIYCVLSTIGVLSYAKVKRDAQKRRMEEDPLPQKEH
eukprot:TRINITY_DN68003_c0_g1_i1.p1 TRINITY_DN68003_c0_g1~~TRINITY_DN68003_c0_g1_i1.p1  ORF type:complete len:120 (-),score=26.01 TRINITY_DN68003_c0_g1_i1:171-530(-)